MVNSILKGVAAAASLSWSLGVSAQLPSSATYDPMQSSYDVRTHTMDVRASGDTNIRRVREELAGVGLVLKSVAMRAIRRGVGGTGGVTGPSSSSVVMHGATDTAGGTTTAVACHVGGGTAISAVSPSEATMIDIYLASMGVCYEIHGPNQVIESILRVTGSSVSPDQIAARKRIVARLQEALAAAQS